MSREKLVLIVLSLSRTYRTKFKLPSQGALRSVPPVTQALNLGPGGVGTSVVSGSSRMESLPGSFLLESVHRVRRHSVRADSELMGHSVTL